MSSSEPRAPVAVDMRLIAPLALAILGDLARPLLVLDHGQQIARLRHPVQAQDLDRHRRAGLSTGCAAIVEQRAHTAPLRAGDDDVADLERAALHQHRGDHAAATIELGLDDRAVRLAVRIGLQVEQLGLQLHGLDQLVEIDAAWWR